MTHQSLVRAGLVLAALTLVGAAITGYKLYTQLTMPTTSRLTDSLTMGPVTLRVSKLEEMRSYYQTQVGLAIVSESQAQTTLGYGDKPSVILEKADVTLAPPAGGAAGLYHSAIVFASRAHLAQTLDRMLSASDSSGFIGSADHLVSEAFYFTDPEGNGLELYFDKAPETWQWQDGRVQMASLYIDPAEYIRQHAPLSADPATKLGHMHLKVGSIDQAKAFYVEILGLKITAEVPGALFVSDGTYHHNLGLNVWESQGASLRNPSLGLAEFELQLATVDDLARLKQRLIETKTPFSEENGSITVKDPWGNQMVLTYLSR